MTNTDLDSGENDTSRYEIHKSYHSRMILYTRIRYNHLQECISHEEILIKTEIIIDWFFRKYVFREHFRKKTLGSFF